MPEDRKIYVAVDSETVGRAWGLSLLIENFHLIVILAIIIGIIIGIMWMVQSASLLLKYGTIDENAIATIEAKSEQSKIVSKLRQIGTINVNQTSGDPANEFVRVDHVEFRDEQILVFFESNTDGLKNWQDSCLTWYDMTNHLGRSQPSIAQQVSVLNNNHVKGYMAYPDSIVIPGTWFDFSFGCNTSSSTSLWTWNDLQYDIELPQDNQAPSVLPPTSSVLASTSTPPSQPLETIVEVQANSDWQNSGVYVQSGETVSIIYVSGLWCPWADFCLDGRGCVDVDPSVCSPDPNASSNVFSFAHAGLIGRIEDGSPFAVGNNVIIQANQAGNIYLRINDKDVQDNSGAITVRLTAGDM
jgi:hypothetical protein